MLNGRVKVLFDASIVIYLPHSTRLIHHTSGCNPTSSNQILPIAFWTYFFMSACTSKWDEYRTHEADTSGHEPWRHLSG